MPERGRISCAGYIESITIEPVDAAPKFTAVVADWDRADTGPAEPELRRASGPGPRLRLVWMGQRRVPGITAGIRLGFEGMVTRADGVPTIYNPRYEIYERDRPRPARRRSS